MATLESNSDAAGLVLTKAALRSAVHLGLNHAALARILSDSEESIARLAAGKGNFEIGTKQAELAKLLVRVCRSLDSLVAATTSSGARGWTAAMGRFRPRRRMSCRERAVWRASSTTWRARARSTDRGADLSFSRR